MTSAPNHRPRLSGSSSFFFKLSNQRNCAASNTGIRQGSGSNFTKVYNNKLSCLWLFVIILLASSCGALKKLDDPNKKDKNQEELDEIQGKRVYNPETGKYEYATEVTETVDTVVWNSPSPNAAPPITSAENTVGTNPNNTTTPIEGGGIIYDPTIDVESPRLESYNVALILPFLTDRFNPGLNELPKNADWAINYYAGTKMAVDRLNQESINLNISVLDTKANESSTISLLSNSALLNADLIIGPYRSRNVQQVADFAKQNQKPLVSPYTASLSVTEENPFYIQVNPSLQTHCEALTRHLRKTYQAQDVVLLSRNNSAELMALKYIQDANYEYEGSTDTERFQEKIFSDGSADAINEEDFTLLIKPNKTTVFVIPSWANEGFVSNILRKISVSKGPNRVVVYGMPQWMNFNRISPDYFERLSVHITSANYTDTRASNIRAFKEDYYNRYGTLPNAEAFLGYDTVLYFGRMINKYGMKFQYYIDRDQTKNLHTTFAFEPVVKAATTGDENYDRIDRFENKFVNVLKFQGFRFILAE